MTHKFCPYQYGQILRCEVICMNMRILDAVRKLPYADPVKNMYFDDMRGFVCFIPSVIVGEPMTIMYSNTISVRHKSTAVSSCSIDCDSGVYTVETAEAVYTMLDLERNRKTSKVRIVSTLYVESRIRHNPLRAETDPDGHLFSDGQYKTKIYASDLPEHFVYGYLYKRHGFISAAGVKHMLYVPDYTFNHRLKYDTLYISYDEPIRLDTGDHGLKLYEGYKHAVSGPLILDFVDAAEKYSAYDVSEIRSEIKRKSDWYDEKYGKDE